MIKQYFKKYINNISNIKLAKDFNLSLIDMSYNNIIYFDNAATSLTPNSVIDAEVKYYKKYKSNIHRGLYKTAEQATTDYDMARLLMAQFLNVKKEEIVWTSGATDSSNKLINIFERNHFLKIKSKYHNKNEVVLIYESHNSELLPIQDFCKRNNIIIKYGIENISENTLFVSMPLVSNVTGEIFDIKNVSQIAHNHNSLLFCDMSAGVGHIDIDIINLDIDAGYFSLHKMLGPTGVGVLFMKRDFSRYAEPTYFGGGMVWEVDYQQSSYRSDIEVFESGTPNIAGVIASMQAIKYLQNIDIKNIHNKNKELLQYCICKFEQFNNQYKKYNNDNDIITLYTCKDVDKNVGTISFVFDNIHAHDIAQILSNHNIAVRSGSHCAMIKMKICNQISMTRLSFYFYNNKRQIDVFFEILPKVIDIFYNKKKL